MAKRIIKNGKYNVTTCPDANGGCGCEFAFDKSDIETKDNKTFVICPQCGTECEVTTKTA
jgi:hypothetical protein